MNRYTASELERFNSKWEQSGDCRLWLGPLDKDGYGTFFFKKRGRRAHRVAYFMQVGDIPEGMVVDHVCKHRHCVAVAHLRAITPRENSLTNSNSIAAKNALRTNCKNGHPFDRQYGNQRYCSICQSEKTKRLRKKWATEIKSVAC
jgi:hypothetical protein